MKILMLYIARSGTNSIAKYFMKQNPDYTYFNQPWSEYSAEEGIKPVSYNDCVKIKNVFIKSEFSTTINNKKHKINKDDIIKDFDKIILLSRRDKREQAISFLVAQRNLAFLNNNKKGYYVDDSDESIIRTIQTNTAEKEEKMKEYLEHGAQLFYYEDLFYGDGFSKLFEFLDLKFIQNDFDEILSPDNRYKSVDLESKKIKSLI